MESRRVTQIDEHHLDRECCKQPEYMYEASSAAAEARRDVMEAKNELEVLEADLQRRIRSTPIKYGCDEKVTEKAIASAVILQDEYKEAQKALIEAQHKAALADALVTALEHKKRSLTLIVELAALGFNSDVKVSREGRDAIREKTKQEVYKRQQEKLGRKDE